MLRDQVAGHYRAKGYTISERAQVRGQSGSIHTVDMVAQGPLGNLVIAIEDAGGFEGPEMHAIRRAAKDIGATPVMAARVVPDGLRRRAAEAGIVLLDDKAMTTTTPDEAPVDDAAIDYPPWPGEDSPMGDRPEIIDELTPRRRKSTDPGIWRYPRDQDESTAKSAPDTAPIITLAQPEPLTEQAAEPEAPTPGSEAFAWLPKEDVAVAPLRQGAPATSTTPDFVRWIVTGTSFGAAAGVVFYALSRILG